jgi:hypothetical protein|tara:strand:- start:1226 stop:1564 length:339 start_codon:yes stop_codon:yes gene_type:complete
VVKRIVDKKHLQYVATQPCFVSKAGFMSCNGPIQVHHLLKPASGMRGFGLRAHDSECIPLCAYHHAQLHTKFGNETKFLKHYGFKKNSAQKYAKSLYEKSSYIDDNDDDLPF